MKLNKVLMLTLCIGALVFTSCKKDTDVIQLKVSEMEISVMGHQKIEVAKASGPIVWSSQDILIASVDEEGDVFGVSEGTTVITATVGKASANVQVTVKPVLLQKLLMGAYAGYPALVHNYYHIHQH